MTGETRGRREFAEGVYFVNNCNVSPPTDEPASSIEDWYVPGRELHSSQRAYILADEKTLLYDTLTPAAEDTVLDTLDEIVDELDYLVISHPEANHAGNAHAILDEHPEATLVAPARGSQHELHGMADLGDDLRLVSHGEELDLGSRTIRFVEEMFFDHAMTIWMFEPDQRILFTSDFMGFDHMGGECLAFAEELDRDLTEDQLRRFNGYAFTWFRFVDPETTDREIDHLIETYDPSIIAPAHGNVIREDATSYLAKMKDVIHEIAEEERDDYHVHDHQMLRINYSQ